jgi:hypothetical protein
MIFIIGCASIKPMDRDAMEKYGLDSNFEKFKKLQYFVSRDIILTTKKTETENDPKSGKIFSSTTMYTDIIQILASTEGKCLDYDDKPEKFRLGIEFDKDTKNLLWFYYNPYNGYFNLDYTDGSRMEIEYAGKIYVTFYGKPKGIGAFFKRIITPKKAKGDYQNKDPLLLYEEDVKQAAIESIRTLPGSKL